MKPTLFIITFALAAAVPSGDDWARITPSVNIQFPRDLGAHPEYRTEWWYVTGEVAGADGSAYGYQFTIFRRGMNPASQPAGASTMRPSQVFAGHFTIADLQKEQFAQAHRIRRGGGGLAGAAIGESAVYLENWELRGDPSEKMFIVASDGGAKIKIDFELISQKKPVLNGEHGYSQKGPEAGNASAYTSHTRLATKGKLSIADREVAVTGESWMDHEWGTSQLGADTAGWDWFGLRLDDGRELMIYGLRRKDGTYQMESAGTMIQKDGGSRRLKRADFTITPGAQWTSSKTGAVYPVEWRVLVPSEGLDLAVKAKIKNAELDTRETTGIIYWEGPVQVSGRGVAGRGYLEMTGYGEPIGGKF